MATDDPGPAGTTRPTPESTPAASRGDAVAEPLASGTLAEPLASGTLAEPLASGPLASGLAHELNNILGIILGNAELASMDSDLSASARTSLEEIEKAGRHGLRVVQQILAFSRGRPIAGDSSGWKAIVDDAARIIRASLPEGMDLELSLTGRAPNAASNRTIPAGTPASPVAASSQPRPDEAARPRCILYLDDEESAVHLASRMLRRRGYEVRGFMQPEKALAAFEQDPAAFDLVVTDYNMPRISGLEIARRTTRLRSDVPVMVITGHITGEMRESAASAGVRHLVEKPDSMDDLCAAVAGVLSGDGG